MPTHTEAIPSPTKTRTESDSMGKIAVPADRYYGAALASRVRYATWCASKA